MQIEGVNSSLAAAAHELKTPLVLLRQLSFELETTDDEARRIELIRRIRLTTERSLRLVDNLTKVARLGDALFEMEPIHLGGLCHEVIDELEPLSRSLGQEFNICLGQRSIVAVGHRELIRSILIGLVDNALQYNRGRHSVRIGLRSSNGNAVVSVRDFGPVINFSQYNRLSQSLGSMAMPISSRPLSSGLGLMIAGKFAETMGGHISVSRHRVGGMTFSAHLPTSHQLSLDGI